ncbi:MAG TPA: hypothetical protein VMM84_00580 [Pyrinomonadaceae bacterium]|nr:hypothetical protein [Pyrinomonadaceae bacterium]
MKRGAPALVLFFILLHTGGPILGQGVAPSGPKKARTPEDYQTRTLKDLDGIKAESGLGDKQERLIVHAAILPSRVRLVYGGATRELPWIKKEVIRQWARLYAGNPDHYTKPYETELLFEEAGVHHWIAVPERSLPQLQEKLKKGDDVELFLIRLGKAQNGGVWESVLLVENFALPAVSLVQSRLVR